MKYYTSKILLNKHAHTPPPPPPPKQHVTQHVSDMFIASTLDRAVHHFYFFTRYHTYKILNIVSAF